MLSKFNINYFCPSKPNSFTSRILEKTMHKIILFYFLLLGVLSCQAQTDLLKLVEETMHTSEKLDTNKKHVETQQLSNSTVINKIKKLADKSFWNNLLYRSLNWMINEIPTIVFHALILVALLRFLRFSVARLKKMSSHHIHHHTNQDDHEREKRIETLSGIILSIGKILLWTIFILSLFSRLNLDIAPVLASAGVVGLAVGFGAQELVRDFISGFFLSWHIFAAAPVHFMSLVGLCSFLCNPGVENVN